MMKLHGAAVLVLSAIGTFACSPSGDAMMRPAQTALSCAIRTAPGPGGVQLQAVAVSMAPAVGRYSFVVTKDDAAGSARMAQEGDFVLAAHEESILGEISLGLGADGSYIADLAVAWDGGETACQQRYPERL